MSVHDACPAIMFGGPAPYRIVVQGILSEHWRDCLAGLAVVDTSRGPDGALRTTLIGRIQDQAELNGVLDTLYGLHLPILKVETINEAVNDTLIPTSERSRGEH